MGLVLPQKIAVNVSTNGSKYFENLGYEIPRYFDKRRNRWAVKNGTTIDINVIDLKPNSNLKVKVQCDICGRIEEMTYMEYTRIKSYIKTFGYEYLCLDCKFDIMPTAKLNVGTFKNNEEKIIKFLIRKLTNFINTYGYPTNKKEDFTPKNSMPTLKMYEDYLKGDLVDWIEMCGYSLSEDEKYEMRHRGGQINETSKEDCIKIILDMQSKLNRPLQYKDFKNPNKNTIGITTIKKYWGTLNKMKEDLGLEIVQESMMDKQLSKGDFDNCILSISNYVKSEKRDFITTREIKLHKDWSSYSCLNKYSQKYYDVNLISYLHTFGIQFGKQGVGINFDFEDGEHITSQFEYMFSKFLKDNGLIYNKDYFRDVKYSRFCDSYKGAMNCDYIINYNNKTIYVEIAGIISNYKVWYYKNREIVSSKSKEKYRKKLKEKENLLIKNDCIYFLLFPCDLTKDNFTKILNNPTDLLRKDIERFMVNNIDWIKVRKFGELNYNKNIIRNTRPLKCTRKKVI